MTGTTPSLDDLETAEDFLNYFEIPYDRHVLNVNRLHILKRFQDYMVEAKVDALDDAARHDRMRDLLAKAYEDFVRSDALTERVFKVHRDAANRLPGNAAFVPLSQIAGVVKRKTE